MTPNILWITLDAVRQNRLSCYGYHRDTTPFLKELAKKSVVFENPITSSIWTLPSVASMFTGAYPSQHGMIDKLENKLRKPTIAQILSDRGFHTSLIGGNPWINSSDLRKGFDELLDMEEIFYLNSPLPKANLTGLPSKLYKYISNFSQILREGDPTAWASSSPRVRKAVQSKISQIEKPFFMYIHFTETHPICTPPLRFQKFGKRRFFLPTIFGKNFGIYSSWFEKKTYHWAEKPEKGLSEEELKILSDAYDNALYHVDYELRKLYKFMKKQNLLQDTAILITSDHGEMLGEGGDIAHQFSFAEPLLKIPLIVNHPNLKPKKVEELIEGKNIFHIVSRLAKGSFDHFWPESDFAFGEWKAYPEIANRVLEKNPERFTSAKYIRSKDLKFVVYGDGNKSLLKVSEGEERINNREAQELMEEIMKIKESKIHDRINDIFDF